jgi:hypothetical protein
MSELAAIRPDEWNLPLFLHVLGAMVVVGGLVFAATALLAASRGGSFASLRVGYRALLFAALPGWIAMRASAQWLLDEEGLEDVDAAWIDIGFITAEPGLLLLIAGTVLAGLAVGRARRAPETAAGVGVRIAAGLILVLLAAYVVSIWAMTTKPV